MTIGLDFGTFGYYWFQAVFKELMGIWQQIMVVIVNTWSIHLDARMMGLGFNAETRGTDVSGDPIAHQGIETYKNKNPKLFKLKNLF